ncbi:hypothetical protein VTO42DRAFT_8647 [Malbranchea cinnamomea]
MTSLYQECVQITCMWYDFLLIPFQLSIEVAEWRSTYWKSPNHRSASASIRTPPLRGNQKGRDQHSCEEGHGVNSIIALPVLAQFYSLFAFLF